MFGVGGELLRERAVRLEEMLGERPGIKVSAGDAAELIREAAGEDGESALVAVGSRGLDALRRLALGSVSTDVLRTARGPVLIFPSTAKDEHPRNGRSAAG
jgi:nucleotide-binding universal stress UspA family protein